MDVSLRITGFRKLLFVFIISLWLCHLSTEAQDYSFCHYTIHDGLPTQRMNCILQDNRGFMWFGTNTGIAFFDGYTFRKKLPLAEDCGLYEVSVACLAQDEDGRIWFGTDGGLYCYDVSANELCRVAPNDWTIDRVRGMAFDLSGCLWVRTEWFFFRLDFKHDDFRIYAPDKYFSPTDFVITKSGNIWILALDGCIYQYNQKWDSFSQYRIIPKEEDDRMKILAKGVEREDGKIVIATCLGGARLFSPTTKHVENLFSTYGDMGMPFTHTMMARSEHEYWFATEQGVYVWLPGGGEDRFVHLQKVTSDSYSLSDNAVHAFFLDKDGGVWVGTAFGGVNYMSTEHNSFSHLYPTDGQGRIAANVIRSIITDDDGALWVGAEDGGVYKYDSQTETLASLPDLRWDGKAMPINIQSLMIVGDDLWIGNFDGSIYVLDRRTGTIKDRLKLPFSFPVDMITTGKGNILVATTVGLLEYAPGKGVDGTSFRNVEGISPAFMHNLCEDSDGNIWVATLGSGVWRGRTDSGRWEKIEFGSESMCTVFEDSKKTIWVGSNASGLFCYNAKEKRGMPVDGILSQIGLGIYRIVEDNRGVLWISSSNGLYSYDLSTETVVRYGLSPMLSSPQFNFNSGVMDNVGRIYFGSLDGMVSFFPQSVEQSEADLTVYFTDYSNEGNAFGVSFSVPIYSIQETLWFRYRLKGVDNEWTIVQGQRNIRYTNLNYGTYVLEVEAALQDGGWTGKTSELAIEIVAPWYATVWAQLLYVLLAVAIVAFGYAKYRERVREKRMADMERQRNEHEKELNHEKMRFFTAMTHEIRTPLTLILTPIESLIASFSAEKAKALLPTMHRNAEVLLNLVNQVLDFRKLEQGRARLDLSHGDFNEFCRTVMNMFDDMARKKNIEFSANLEGTIYMNFDKDKMQRILTNLLSNAFKFTSENGRICVETAVRNERCVLKVTDNGIGIDGKDLPNIFDLFYQCKPDADPALENQVSGGSGLGLHLVKELVEVHLGTVSVESRKSSPGRPEHGTIFTISLPMDLTRKPEVPGWRNDGNEETENSLSDSDGMTDETVEGLSISGDSRIPTLLLVDDNEEFRQYLTIELCDDYQILQASNGREAYDMALANEVDIVVSDVMMPIMDGTELCRQLKGNVKTSHILVVLLTAKVGEEHRLAGYKSGADYYVAKPFNIEILKNRIAHLCKMSVQRHDMFINDVDVTPQEMTTSKLDEEIYAKAVELVNENMANEEYSVEQFSSDMCMSRMTLYRKLKTITGQKPLEFIHAIRLKKAAMLLKTTEFTIVEIAEMVGYGTSRNFSKNFKAFFGKSPSEYKS